MGQAKARGTAEVRQKEGIEKAKAAEVARKRALFEAEAALTPEQRAKRKETTLLLATLMGMTVGNTMLIQIA